MQSNPSSQRGSRSHFAVTNHAQEDLNKLELNRRQVHQALSRGQIVDVKVGQRMPDAQIGDHTFPGLVREVVSEFEHHGVRIGTRGDNIISAKPAPIVHHRSHSASSAQNPEQSDEDQDQSRSISASSTHVQEMNESLGVISSRRHKSYGGAGEQPPVEIRQMARSMVVRGRGSRVAAREGGIRAKLPGPSVYRLPADKQVEQLQQRLDQLQDGGKFRHSSAVFRKRLMAGVESDWNTLLGHTTKANKAAAAQSNHGGDTSQSQHERKRLLSALHYARDVMVASLQKIGEQATHCADDGLVVAEAAHVIKRMHRVE